MKKLFLFAAALFFTVSNINISYSQDDNMKKWMDYMTPGDMHKMLANGTGTWKAKTTYWMAPGGEAAVNEGSAVGEMILGGRYLMSKFTGSVMGMPFEGMSIEGYDNATKMFNSAWIDNMGTGIMYMTGKYDAATKQITYTGKAVDPMSGIFVDMRQIVTYNNDGSTKMEMYGPGPDGKEFKTMEVIFTR